MNLQGAVLVNRDVLWTLLADIREDQPRQRAEAEDIPDAVQPLVGHRPLQQQVQLRLRQRHFDVRLIDLHLVVAEEILFDPFVADGIEQEVFQTAEQIDRPVVVAVVGRLHEGIQSVDVGIVDRLQRKILLAVHLPDIFGHVAQQAVVLVGRELCDAGADSCWRFSQYLPNSASTIRLEEAEPSSCLTAKQVGVLFSWIRRS